MTRPLRAACLTPPAIGGIAVIQVVGPGADRLVSPHLRKGRAPLDLTRLSPRELRFCRIVDGEEIIDDAIVCVRTTPADESVVDLNLHGGARVVQRVLLMLQREGVRIVEPHELLDTCWPARTPLHADAIRLLPHAKTRAVALWLARLPDLLVERIETILSDLEQARVTEAITGLNELLTGADVTSLLLEGVRVVLIGRPNSGKSTLANTLAEREYAIVSDLPGTTRDWTEHPAAIEGVPFTIVDTAGIRATADPIEAEAIRRAHLQISQARIIIRVIDPTQPSDMPDSETPAAARRAEGDRLPVLDVYNKADLTAPPQASVQASRTEAVRISARTGEGIDRLRRRLLELAGLRCDTEWPTAPFTPQHVGLCRQAGEAITKDPVDRTQAAAILRKLLDHGTLDERTSQERL